MYTPSHFKIEQDEEAIDFIKTFSFAPIISVAETVPIATHIPFIIEKKSDKLVISSHFARANPQWKNIEGQKSLVIFSEPHAYISPTHYQNQQSVPTWNYIAIHVYGSIKLITDQKASFELLEKTILTFEASYKLQWDGLSEEYKLNMFKGIVPFELEVTELQGSRKLSQNKSEAERKNIINTLLKSSDTNEQEIGRRMKMDLGKF